VYGRYESVDSHLHLHSEVNAKATLRSGDWFIQRIDVHDRHLVFGNRGGCFADHRVLAKLAAAKTVSHQHHWCRARKLMTATSGPGARPSRLRRLLRFTSPDLGRRLGQRAGRRTGLVGARPNRVLGLRLFLVRTTDAAEGVPGAYWVSVPSVSIAAHPEPRAMTSPRR
jgi:hypothetical protein